MQKYNCKNCGAELYWDSNANCLKCEYCDEEYQVSDFETSQNEDTKQTKELRDVDEFDKATDESESSDLVVYKCTHCGAEVVTAKSTVATTCAYCGRAIALTNKMVGNFKPELAIPFAIDDKKAKEAYKKYIKSSFLTPKSFIQDNVIEKIKGVYVPFWLHSFNNNTNAVIHCENQTSRRRGDDKIITHHMYDVTMDASGDFANIPTDALKNLDNKLMDAVEPFDYNKMQPFSPAYMAGFYAEEYNEDEKATFDRAAIRARDAMETKMKDAAGSYSTKVIERTNEVLTNKSHKYAMLPVWLLNVEHNNKSYQFAVNGETGKVVGKLPISIPKLLILAGSSAIGTQLIAFVIRLISAMGGF